MNDSKNLVIGVLAALFVVFAGLSFYGLSRLANLEDVVLKGETLEVEHLQQGFDAGTGRQFAVSNVGALVSSGPMTLSNTLDVTGLSQLAVAILGGGSLDLATGTPPILSSAQVCANSVINVQDWAGRASTTDTLTTPSATAFYAGCLESQGKHWTIIVRNKASAAASTTQITAGTNIVLTESDNSSGADVVIAGGNGAILDFWRVGGTATSSGVYLHVEEFRDAD